METIRAKLLIFDLDGTLADTVPAIAEAINLALDVAGYPHRDEEYVRRSVGNGALVLSRRVMPEEFASDTDTLMKFYRIYDRKYTEIYDHTRTAYAYIPEALRELRRRGYTLAVLSNKQQALVVNLVRDLFPDGEFSAAQGLPEGMKGKPDPTLCLFVVSALGFKPADAVMIGDGETDIAVAKAAGLGGSLSVTWGYRSREELLAGGAEAFIDDPRQLTDVFPPLTK